jgi:hypothetical protein
MLREYFELRQGADVHLRLITKVEIDGTVLHTDHDAVAVQTTPETTMLVPFSAIQFIRENTPAVRLIREASNWGSVDVC